MVKTSVKNACSTMIFRGDLTQTAKSLPVM
ncbi:hypothetical protein N783_02720 [Pontibacillus marinus BH030004 = DSM 16465]|uniref:Uncharacterized protein n=1 Tax=Pontibacillus marinus BH030004 = DSM 16465 TaxID=1385511 RepID=A0A0A5FXJ6_9BACI|nr:hypothetical protein N783_02720 [Pontibacillus marinus BH030004 = DSM 16465]